MVAINPAMVPIMPHLKGPPLVGFMTSSAIFGSAILTFVHYLNFGSAGDRRAIRMLAWLVAFWSFVSMGFVLATTMRQYAFRYGQSPSREDGTWNCVNYALDAVMRLLVSGFFAHRAWKMWDKAWWTLLILVPAIVMPLVGSFGALCTSLTAHEQSTSLSDTFNYFWISSEMAGDLVITFLITHRLWFLRSGWKQTDSVIRKLMVIGAETQLPPTLVACGFLIVYATAPQPAYIGFFVCMPLIYSLCFFIALNARHKLSVQRQVETSGTFKDTHSRNQKRGATTAINVTTETYTHADDAVHVAANDKPRFAGNRGAISEESLPDSPKHADMNTSEIRLV